MNEFDLLSAAINTAIKHGNHNQKLHGRRFGPDTGGGSDDDFTEHWASVLATDVESGVIGLGDTEESRKKKIEVDKMAKEKYMALKRFVETPIPTPEQKSSLKSYQSTGYRDINASLHGRKTFIKNSEEIADDIQNIDALMSSSRLTRDAVVFRGVRMKDPKRIEELTTVGNIVSRKGYLSTTMNMNTATDFSEAGGGLPEGGAHVIMHIKVPAGNRALRVDSITGTSVENSEHEVLLPHNSRMIVRAVRKEPFNKPPMSGYITHVDVELLPEDTP